MARPTTQRKEIRVSLYPLTLEEALRIALQTPPAKKRAKKKAKPKPPPRRKSSPDS